MIQGSFGGVRKKLSILLRNGATAKDSTLAVSALNTKIAMFTWNRNWTMRHISVGGNTITLFKTVKFLGVTLDNKLNYNTHIDNVTQKATADLMQCKRAVGPMWGLSPKTCKWIYKTVIRPILPYSATVWVRALDNKNNLKKLERVQALALRNMTGDFPSTPFNSLNHLTKPQTLAATSKEKQLREELDFKAIMTGQAITTIS